MLCSRQEERRRTSRLFPRLFVAMVAVSTSATGQLFQYTSAQHTEQKDTARGQRSRGSTNDAVSPRRGQLRALYDQPCTTSRRTQFVERRRNSRTNRRRTAWPADRIATRDTTRGQLTCRQATPRSHASYLVRRKGGVPLCRKS